MDRRDDMSGGTDEPAVRVISPDEDRPLQPPEPVHRRTPWLLPGTALLGLLAVFIVTTGPSEPTPTTTTQAPSISAVEPETIDLRTIDNTDHSLDWELVPFDDSADVNDLVYDDGLYLAGGASSEGATVWWSRGGSMWNPAITIHRPEGPSSIEEIVPWDGGFVALGGAGLDNRQVGIWTAEQPAQTWEYNGTLSSDSGPLVGLAAGQRLFAVTEDESGFAGWTSPDGVAWTRLGPLTGLADAAVYGLVSDGNSYYVFGSSRRGDGGGYPAVYRSEDGIVWGLVGLSDEPGVVTDIAVDRDRMVAVGQVPTRTPDRDSLAVSLWESHDGISWQQTALDSPELYAPNVSFTVTETAPGDNPTARLLVSDTAVTVTEGTTLHTEIGSVVVEDIIDLGVEIRGDGFSTLLRTNQTADYPGNFLAERIAVEGSRIAISGTGWWMAPQTVVWASGDGGSTWSRRILPAPAARSEISTNGGVVTMLTSGGDLTRAWRANWDPAIVEEAGVAVVEAYFDAINRGDTDLISSLLPAERSGTILSVPSLGDQDPGWWDDDGNLDRARIADTMAYLTALNTSISIDECSAQASFSTDRITVACLYTVTSDLLTALGIVDGAGRIDIVVRDDGAVRSAAIPPAGSESWWRSLSTLFRNADDDRALTFTAISAEEHLAATRDFVSGLLKPGETRTVDTALGTMEWSWLEPDEFSSMSGPSIVWSPVGYVLTGHSRTSEFTWEPQVYVSGDGLDWEQTELPEDIDEIWGVTAFADGVLAKVRLATNAVALVYFDGSDWTPIPFPVDVSVDYGPTDVGDDLALVLVWEINGDPSEDAVLLSVGPDLEVTEASLPPLPDSGTPRPWIELVAGDDGFAAFATDPLTGSVSVWTTDDGQEWVLLTETIALNNAQYISNPQRHAGRYFVVGPGMELQCVDTALGEECAFWAATWTSSDGAVWRQLATEDGGPVLATGIASGPLGLAAFGALDTGRPAWVYLSADGELWHVVEEISLLGDVDRWWWTATPAVGEDSIIAVGGSYRESITLDPDSYDTSDESFFMIVGRLVE